MIQTSWPFTFLKFYCHVHRNSYFFEFRLCPFETHMFFSRRLPSIINHSFLLNCVNVDFITVLGGFMAKKFVKSLLTESAKRYGILSVK